jgi:glycosyltransferase involved in cell wall biosynthesis
MTNLDLGGAQMFVMRLAEELSSKGHEVYVYNQQPEWSDPDFQNSFSDKVKVISYGSKNTIYWVWKLNGLINKFSSSFNFRNRFNERVYRKTLKKFNFDVINSQMWISDKLTSKVATDLNIPFVITTHGEYELNLSGKNKNFGSEAVKCLATAKAVIYTAQKNIDAIHSLLPDNIPVRKIIVGFNGDAIPRFKIDPVSLGIGEDDFVIGMVARGIPEKGWSEVIEMFHLLKKQTSRKLHLLLIGNGANLKKEFEAKKVPGMSLLQFTKNPLEYFSWISRFDAGLLLSYFKGESVPNVVIEYLYHHAPVIATQIGDIKEMISSENGMAGEFVPLKDNKADPEKAAQVILRMLDDKEYYQTLKENTKAAFRKFEMKKIAEEYLEVYRMATGK